MNLPIAQPDSAAELPSHTLPISETFTSIQGEGLLTGAPSFFIRTSGCNLRCTWCDTPYASWTPQGERSTIAQLVDAARASGVRHAVLTGGEPMLFEPLGALCRALKDAGMHITIETAGTIHRPRSDTPYDLLSLSPKLASSTPAAGDPRDPTGAWRARHEERRLNIPVLQALINDSPDARQLKFVVAAPEDLAEIDALLAQLSGLLPAQIMLMPEGVTPPPPSVKTALAAECLRRGWRFCGRLHIDLFGNRRGT